MCLYYCCILNLRRCQINLAIISIIMFVLISIYLSPEQSSENGIAGHVQISNNTGSLPDLTNLNFPSPLSMPLDGDTTSGSGQNQNNVGALSMQQQQQQRWLQQLQQQQQAQQQQHGDHCMNSTMIPPPLILHGGSNHLLMGNTMVTIQVSIRILYI